MAVRVERFESENGIILLRSSLVPWPSPSASWRLSQSWLSQRRTPIYQS